MTALEPQLSTRILAARAAWKAAHERYDLAQRDGRCDIVKTAAVDVRNTTAALDKLLEELLNTG